MKHPATLITSLETHMAEQKRDHPQKLLDGEGNMHGMIDEAKCRAKDFTVELERKLEGAIPGLLSDLEEKFATRVGTM